MKENLVNPFNDKYPQYLSFSMTVLLLALTFFLSMVIALQSQEIHNASEKLVPRTIDIEPINENTDINSWKLYENKTYRFSLQYPSSYFISDIESGVIVAEKKWEYEYIHHPYLTFTLIENNKILEKIAQKEIDSLKSKNYGILEEGCTMHCISDKPTEIVVGENLQAWKYSTWGVSGGSDFILVSNPEKNNEIVQIENHTAASRDPGETSIPENILGQILSTFKFTEKQSLDCPEGQYPSQCELGPCCCPNGAFCD